MWIIFSLVSLLTHGISNILDNYLSNNIYQKVTTLTFLSSLFGILILPIIILISPPEIPTLKIIPYLILLGLIEILYIIPYYKSLQIEDTSIVISLFSLGHIFVPVLAYFFIHERLEISQYLGFILIIFTSAMLVIKKLSRIRFNKAFYYMLLVSALLAIETIIYKYVLYELTWSSIIVWTSLTSFIFASGILFKSSNRKDILISFSTLKNHWKLFTFGELLSYLGTIFYILAIEDTSVTLVEGLTSTQPVMVMLVALVYSKFNPKYFNENITKGALQKKIILFSIMSIGVILILK